MIGTDAKSKVFAALVTVAMAGAPAGAATIEELEAMSDVSANEEAGIAAAQAQQERGQWLEALGTLERVLAEHPRSAGARLLHALYLCKVDDRQGGQVELSKLRARDYADGVYDQVRGECGLPPEGRR